MEILGDLPAGQGPLSVRQEDRCCGDNGGGGVCLLGGRGGGGNRAGLFYFTFLPELLEKLGDWWGIL